MSSNDNPFASGAGGGGYDGQTVSFGTGDPASAQPVMQTGTTATGVLVKDTTTATFQADVIAESRNQPVIIDFWAPWCGPCKQLTPRLEAAVQKAGGKVKMVKMNIDEHPSIPGQMGVQSIPAVIAFRDGQPVDAFMGAVPDSQIDEFIDKLAGASGKNEEEAIKQALEAASAAIAAGDSSGAAQIYSMILDRFPDNAPAYGGLAGLMFDAGQTDRVKAMIENAPESIAGGPEIASVEARLELAEKVAGLGEPVELERRIEADAGDHEARFDLAQIRNATGDRDAAADLLLEVMRQDRTWRDDGARLELLKFFEAWGPTDEATVKARRKLSSMLFR